MSAFLLDRASTTVRADCVSRELYPKHTAYIERQREREKQRDRERGERREKQCL